MNHDGAPFGGGFLMGLWSSISIWNLQINPSNLFLEIIGKIGMTILLGLAGGLAGMLAKDIYKILKKIAGK